MNDNNRLPHWQIKKILWLNILIIASCVPPPPIHPSFELPKPREELKVTLSKPLTTFESAGAQNDTYFLGAGDEITVGVWGYPELSGQHIIGPDGKITLPLVGTVKVADSSREQASTTITKLLTPYYADLTTTVRVDRYASNRVLVLGRVVRPGEVHFGMTNPTLLEAISLAGGLAEATGLEGAESLPFSRCAVFRGRDQLVWIELEPLFTGRDLSLNLRLQRNDIVYIPELEERLVYVLGQVYRPGAFRLKPQMSFFELLAKAGGPTEDAAPGRINLIRPDQGINQSISLERLITPNQYSNVALQEGDVIYVPTNTIAKINYAVRFLSPFSTMLGIYADIESIRADKESQKLDEQERRLQIEQDNFETEKAQNTGLE
jgi:polysaccharide export outer membrane protein